VVRALRVPLGPGAGRSLADLAGGTGNYGEAMASDGFRVTVVDAQPAMLERSVPKLGRGRAVVGDVHALPLRDGSFDVVTIISALHLFAEAGAALREARRVIREGPFVLMAFTLENLKPLFVYEYFDNRWPTEIRTSQDEILSLLEGAGFRDLQVERFAFTDTADGSVAGLHTDAAALADEDHLKNTSFWHRIGPDVRARGLAGLAADLRSGVLERRIEDSKRAAATFGHGTVISGRP
jgi:SAM-dependent methyltransferase